MKLEDMTAREIIEKYDFSPAFMKSFRDWCDAQPYEARSTYASIGQYFRHKLIVNFSGV